MDFATTMDALSWEFYNRFFNVLVDYGIVYLPLLIFLYQNWLSEDILCRDANQTIVSMSLILASTFGPSPSSLNALLFNCSIANSFSCLILGCRNTAYKNERKSRKECWKQWRD
jgi:hypothetical protein